jgi:tRNA pseudouridine38-40 synthase
MKTIFLQVEYLGAHYCGFQIQNKKNSKEITVQEVLEKALKKLFHANIRIGYVSRTDSGVHAKDQGVSFAVDTKIPLTNIKRALNSYLPSDVRVVKVKSYPGGWRIQNAVKSKLYRYTIDNKQDQSVFDAPYAWHLKYCLDLSAMRMAAAMIVGKRDFSVFAKNAKQYADPVRHVKMIKILVKNGRITIDVAADGFLHNMVRNIVGFLVQVGCGKITLADAKKIIALKAPYFNYNVPPHGLCLMKLFYV